MSDTKTSSDSSSIENDHRFTSIKAIQEYDWSDFERREAERGMPKPYVDPQILAYSYWIEGLSQSEIGRRYGVSGRTVGYHMDKQGVPTEAHPSHFQATLTYAHESAKGGTYDFIWSCCNGKRYDAYAHHLVACVENDPHEVFRDGTDVHHETGHPLDNRPDALSVVERTEHPKPESRRSQWIIENGEPRLRMDPDKEAPNPVEEWWTDDDVDEDRISKEEPAPDKPPSPTDSGSSDWQDAGVVIEDD